MGLINLSNLLTNLAYWAELDETQATTDWLLWIQEAILIGSTLGSRQVALPLHHSTRSTC